MRNRQSYQGRSHVVLLPQCQRPSEQLISATNKSYGGGGSGSSGINGDIRVNFIMRLCASVVIFLLLLRHTNAICGPTQWQCDNQLDCIDTEDRCNGIKNCPDGSDEVAANCFHVTKCPGYLFQCSYGACVSRKAACNGTQECVDNSDELLCEGKALTNLQGGCSSPDKMQCLSSSECIDLTDVCDGYAHCADASDESIAVCAQSSCPKGFRCAYGACVAGHARCNNSIECHDGSDEAWEMCGYERKFPPKVITTMPRAPFVGMCQITEEHKGLHITVFPGPGAQLGPGAMVEDEMSIRASCINNPAKKTDIYCDYGKWIGTFPTCRTYCSRSELDKLSTNYICTHNSIQNDRFCSKAVLTNTTVTFFCSPGYYSRSWQRQELQCLENGTFTAKRRPCDHRCGQLIPNIDALTRNGFPIQPSTSPWHVAIYRNDDGQQTFICGGSIISPSYVVTAAHCFWNHSVPTSPHLYSVMAGKSRNSFSSDSDGVKVQLSEVLKISISTNYSGLFNNYYADLAILQLKQPLRYNENVSAICLNTPRADSEDYVDSDIVGSITGFGKTGNLERLSMATINHRECQKLPDGSSLAKDKFCLRNANLNSTLCQGDSGGGFVRNINGDYYLVGVVSYTPITQGGCVSAPFVGLSNVLYMKQDLVRVLEAGKSKDRELF